MRAADRLARREALVELRFVELEAQLAQSHRHPQRARLAVGEEFLEALRQRAPLVVKLVAEDVQLSRDRPVLVDRRDLDRGNHPHPRALARRNRLRHSRHRVVVGEREQLHASLARRRDDVRRREFSVGASGVRLQVEAQLHRARVPVRASDAVSRA